MDYQVHMKEEKLYHYLEKIEGLESITSENPADDTDGPPFWLIVDGYEFYIDGDLNVEYRGPAKGTAPEITKMQQEVKNETEIDIYVEAKTTDEQGLSKIILLCNGNVVEEKEVSGKTAKETFTVTNNGGYRIKVIAGNKKQAISEIIEVTKIVSVNGTLTAGTVTEANVLLSLHGESKKEKIKAVEIYANHNLTGSKSYPEGVNELDEKFTIQDMPFYEDINCYAVLVDELGNRKETTRLNVKNTNGIANATDLKKLADETNKGENFSGKTLTILKDIELNGNSNNQWIPIGVDINKPFEGHLDGNGKKITGIYMNNNEVTSNGLFGHVKNGSIKNLELEGQIFSQKENSRMGGIVAFLSNGEIENCVNKAQIKNEHGWTGGVVGAGDGTFTITRCANHGEVSSTDTGSIGGIIGSTSQTVEKGVISLCYNTGTITTDSTAGGGGVLGVANSVIEIDSCYNVGAINSGDKAGGIVGYVHSRFKDSTLTISNCYNVGNLTGSRIGGIIGYKEVATYTCSLTITNSYYLNTCNANATYDYAAVSKTATQLQGMANTLGSNFKENTSNVNKNNYPIFSWQ